MDHRLLGVEHAFVHIDIDDLRTALDLIARDIERLGIGFGLDQTEEFFGACDVGTLTDIDKQTIRIDGERL